MTSDRPIEQPSEHGSRPGRRQEDQQPPTDPSCLFCRIVAGEIPATVIAATAETVAFRDVAPQAPVHVLVVPRSHVADIADLSADADLFAAMGRDIVEVARAEGLEDYRVVFNRGAGAGQSVFHVHAHVLGGRLMGWPPG
jgi:histidine triad (HIT) family protein